MVKNAMKNPVYTSFTHIIMWQLTSSPCTSGLRSGVSFISPAREKSRTTSAVETKYTTLHVDAIIFGILTENAHEKEIRPTPYTLEVYFRNFFRPRSPTCSVVVIK